MTKSNFASLDVEGHDGSTGGLYLGGTLVTALASELNKVDRETAQVLAAAGAITVKNGICIINATEPGAIEGTLADPVAGTDDFKTLLIICGAAQANTVQSDSSFGGGGIGEDKGTFTQLGDTLFLTAYNGVWYVTGSQHCTIA